MTLRRLLDTIALCTVSAAAACTASPPRADTTAAAPPAALPAAPETTASVATPPAAVDTPPVVKAPTPRPPARQRDSAPADTTPRRPRPAPRPPHPVPLPMPRGDEDAEREAIERLRQETKALAHTEGCSAADQCTVLPLGERACGGPEEYVVYCPRSTDVTALKRKADALLDAERAFNKKYDVMSTCEMRLAPTPTLAGGRCTAAPSTAPRPSPLHDR